MWCWMLLNLLGWLLLLLWWLLLLNLLGWLLLLNLPGWLLLLSLLLARGVSPKQAKHLRRRRLG